MKYLVAINGESREVSLTPTASDMRAISSTPRSANRTGHPSAW